MLLQFYAGLRLIGVCRVFDFRTFPVIGAPITSDSHGMSQLETTNLPSDSGSDTSSLSRRQIRNADAAAGAISGRNKRSENSRTVQLRLRQPLRGSHVRQPSYREPPVHAGRHAVRLRTNGSPRDHEADRLVSGRRLRAEHQV